MADTYSVPSEARRILSEGIFKNPRLAHNIPEGAAEMAARSVKIKGTDKPSIPINWRFAESVTALKAYEASVVSLFIKKKYGVDVGEVVIDSDHASLFFMTPLIAQIVGEDGKPKPFNPIDPSTRNIIPTYDKYDSLDMYRGLATNIYRTKDNRFFHLHGSMNATPTLTALGLPPENPSLKDFNAITSYIQAKVEKYAAAEIDELMNEKHRQAGCIALSTEEYFASESGKANYAAGLYEVKKTDDSLPASWWPEDPSKPCSARRPLAGLKIVDLSRVIAGPTITRSLAELGASVMRVTGPDVTDLSAVHHDLNWGKWNCHLDLGRTEDRKKLWSLILEADVIVDGYRPGVMERRGFGCTAVFEAIAAHGRGRGIVYVRENCYGWYGPWSHRSGWQQVSDVCCGISLGFGRAMGNDEAVTPVFPNADFCTGIQGCVGVLHALIQRAETGGSYSVDTALNYYSAWLAESVGEYPPTVWEELYGRHGKPVFRHNDNMQRMFPVMLPLLHKLDGPVLFNPAFFEERRSSALGATFVFPKPVLQFTDKTVELKYDVGTRGNGLDAPVWPKDLTVEVVKG